MSAASYGKASMPTRRGTDSHERVCVVIQHEKQLLVPGSGAKSQSIDVVDADMNLLARINLFDCDEYLNVDVIANAEADEGGVKGQRARVIAFLKGGNRTSLDSGDVTATLVYRPGR